MVPKQNKRRQTVQALTLIAVLAIALGAATFATLSAGVNGPDEEVFLPIIRAPGTPVIPDATTGSLQDGGLMTGLDGLMVGAVTGTISTTLQVTITRVANTAIPLGDGLTPLGDTYTIAAGRDLYPPTGFPLMIGLPVAAGTDVSHLAMAVLITVDTFDGPAANWFTFRGVYDAAAQMFLAAIGGLAEGGYQVVLVDAPDQSPLPAVLASRSPLRAQANDFIVNCAASFQGLSQPCGPADEAAAANQLLDAYNRFQDTLNFNEPHLLERWFLLDPFGFFVNAEYYNIFLTPFIESDCDPEGKYVPEQYLKICINVGETITDLDNVTRHEYFHATQRGYKHVREGPRESWITEGTASAAEYSFQTMTRTLDYDLRPVDIPLASAPIGELRQYEAQDFWVFAGRKNNQGLDYLHALFEKGASTANVVEVLGDKTHLPIYWDWVKNQVIEKTETFDGALTDPCSLTPEVVTSILSWNFDHTASLTHTVGLLEPLNTVVVGVIWDGKYDVAEGSVVPNGGTDDTEALSALRYKMYRDEEKNCDRVPDGRRLFEKKDGEISSANFYWVVISNIHPTKPYAYTIRFEVDPVPPNLARR